MFLTKIKESIERAAFDSSVFFCTFCEQNPSSHELAGGKSKTPFYVLFVRSIFAVSREIIFAQKTSR